MDVVLRIDPSDAELADRILSEAELEPQQIKTAGIDGGNDLVSILISLSSHGLTALVAILAAKWKRNKDVVIEAGGMKIKGANPEQIEGILKQMIELKDKSKKRE